VFHIYIVFNYQLLIIHEIFTVMCIEILQLELHVTMQSTFHFENMRHIFVVRYLHGCVKYSSEILFNAFNFKTILQLVHFKQSFGTFFVFVDFACKN
jgi:hypothetical protein